MIEFGGVEDEQTTVDWDHIFETVDLNFDGVSPDSGWSLSIEDIEQLLLNDGDLNPPPEEEEEQDQNVVADEFFSDILVDSPPASDTTEEEEKEEEKSPEDIGGGVAQAKDNNNNNNNVGEDDDDDDPMAKKRKRQMRNRDAAVRSRERKKMYVRDLELKSKYYEAECRRLGMLLHNCLAENQALRLSLHNSKAFDASMTKQESAVLLLESLLLGSLLGFLGIICLLLLPSQLLFTLEAGLLENAASGEWERRAPRKEQSKLSNIVPSHSFMISKRCKASRSRMKLRSATPVVVV